MKFRQIYDVVRPLLDQTGVLKLARSVFTPNTRARIAQRIGLGSYIPPVPSRTHYTGSITVDGINYIADMRSDIGLGESARSIYNALRTTGLPLNYQEVVTPLISRTHSINTQATSGLYGITLAHLNPPELHLGMQAYPASFNGRYTIGYWLWETPRTPERWSDRLGSVDEVWTPSRYTQNILQQVAKIPIHYIPIPISVPTSGTTRKNFGLPEDRFIFFFAFNPGSSMARKNPYGVIEAYQRAFGNEKNPPLLVIKAHRLNDPLHHKIAPALRQAVQNCGGILIEQHLNREQMNDLIAVSDCFISLHRAEGFGLIIAEAMALGKPVIATNYSSNTDFMNDSNSFGVNYILRVITEEDHRDQPTLGELYQAGQLWAEPDLDHAAELMRFVFENDEEAKVRAAIAKRDIETGWNTYAIGEQIKARLQQLEAKAPFG